MVGLVVRFSRRKLFGYFHGDFDPAIWQRLSVELGKVCSPKIFLPGENFWRSFSFEEFVNYIPQQSSRVLTYEFGFSPPKSFSLAALLGFPAREDLLLMHSQAVGDAVSFITQSLVPRGAVPGRLFGQVLELPLLRFMHFSNRVNEPQVHEHVIVIARGADGSADGGVLFDIQKALDVVYLHTLSVLLRRAGYELEERGHRWEIRGVSAELRRRFSSRSAALSEEWKPARKRILLLRQHRELGPKASWDIFDSLLRKWGELGREVAYLPLPRVDPAPESAKTETSLDELFRANSTQSYLDLVVSQIRSGCSDNETSGELLGNLGEYLTKSEQSREIVIGFERGIQFCHTEVFQKEEAVLQMFGEGLGRGTSISLPTCSPRLAVLKRALTIPNHLRLVELSQDDAWEACRLFGEAFHSRFSLVPELSAGAILEALGPPSNQQHLILVVKSDKQPVKSGFRSELLRMLCSKRKTPRLQRGRVGISVVGFGSCPQREIFRTVQSGDGTAVVAGVGSSQELVPVATNFATFAGRIGWRVVSIDELQPWATRDERSRLGGSSLVGIHQSPLIRHGTFWKVVSVDEADFTVESVSGRRKSIPWLAAEGVRGKVEFVREVEVLWPIGTSAKVLRSFSSGRNRVKAGEWHRLEYVSQCGMLVLEAGIGLPTGFRLLEPRVFTTEPELSGVDDVFIWHESGPVTAILDHKPRRRLIVVTRNPGLVRDEIVCELQRRRDSSKKTSKRPLVDRTGRVYWRGFLGIETAQTQEPPKRGSCSASKEKQENTVQELEPPELGMD